MIFDLLASLLEYPDENYSGKLKCCEDLSADFNEFTKFVKENSLETLQELYVRTFDVNPVCTLYSGSVIFGEESFKRARFLERLKQAHIDHNIDTGSELPDFIPLVLRLASRLEDKEKLESLLKECILGPLEAIQNALNKDSNPYENVIFVLRKIIKEYFNKEKVYA